MQEQKVVERQISGIFDSTVAKINPDFPGSRWQFDWNLTVYILRRPFKSVCTISGRRTVWVKHTRMLCLKPDSGIEGNSHGVRKEEQQATS